MPDLLPPRLVAALRDCGPLAIAVSGGVDSLTLAVAAQRSGLDAWMLHAASPAVPPEATARVRQLASQDGWRLEIVDAGEFADPVYRANPVNRCYFCKTHLYATLRARTGRRIVSGANLDDLGEYRPGLEAAREHGVRHPYIEAGMAKPAVRRLAATLGLGFIAELPASPCLSSRVETGIAIDAGMLALVHAVEQLVSGALEPRTVRCRVRPAGLVVELDAATLARLPSDEADALAVRIGALATGRFATAVRFAPYRNGSAFRVDAA